MKISNINISFRKSQRKESSIKLLIKNRLKLQKFSWNEFSITIYNVNKFRKKNTQPREPI